MITYDRVKIIVQACEVGVKSRKLSKKAREVSLSHTHIHTHTHTHTRTHTHAHTQTYLNWILKNKGNTEKQQEKKSLGRWKGQNMSWKGCLQLCLQMPPGYRFSRNFRKITNVNRGRNILQPILQFTFEAQAQTDFLQIVSKIVSEKLKGRIQVHLF